MPLEFDIVTGLSNENSLILKQDTALRLAKIYDENRPNLNTGSVTMPQVPNLIGDARLAPQEDRSSLAIKNWLAKTKQLDQEFMSGSGTETLINAKGTEKYLDQQYGYNPQRDNEDYYAKQQKWYSEVPKALVKFVPLTLAKVGTGLGYLAGLLDPTNFEDGYISNAADNGIVRVFDQLEQTIKNDWMPSFQEAADRDKGFFSRAFTDLNFWTEDTLDAAAFLASAFVPGLGISKVGVGAKASSLLSRLGIAAENGVLGNTGLAKLASYTRNAANVASTLDRAVITAVNTASEAMWEAKGVRDGVIESLSGKINPDTGRSYTEIEKRRIAAEAAQSTFLANAALLSISNLWETNLLFKALNKEGKSVNNIVQKNIGESFEAAKSASKLTNFFESKPGSVIKAFGEGLATEGLYEENMQLAVQRVYDNTAKYGNVFTQLFGQTRDAFFGNDPEAATSIGLGGLIGGGASIVGNFREISRTNLQTQKLVEELNRAQSNWLSFGSLYQRDADGRISLDSNNNPILDINKANAAIENWSQMTNLKLSMDATTNPELTSVIQKEAFAKFVKAHINAGITDQLNKKLDDLAYMSDEQLVLLGYDPSSNSNRNADIADLKNYAQNLIRLQRSIDNDILYKSEKLGEFSLRKNYLYTLGARQLALQNMSDGINQELSSLKGRIDTVSGTSVDDTYVDQLNYLNQRITAQRLLIAALDNYDLDGTDTNKESEQKELASLTKSFNELKNSNKELFNSLTIKNDYYQYPNPEKNRNILTQTYNNKQKLKAQFDNSIKSINTEFYNVADSDNGAAYFRNKLQSDLDKIKESEDLENPPVTTEQSETTGLTKTIKMKSITNPDEQVDVVLEEGKRYLGALTKTEYGSKKGLRGTAFNNDNIKVIKINDDGSVLLTINEDSPVLFTEEELSDIPAIKKYADLSPLQKFYLENRNKVFQYRIPLKYNNKTKGWETFVVSSRLSYNKKDNILNIAYKVGDNVKYIEFNPKYIVSSFDISELPTDEQLALREQQQKLDNLRAAQYRLFESLINNTDVEIQQQKERTEANLNALSQTEERLQKLESDLKKYENEFELTDKTKIEDKRTKAARVLRIINKLKSEISIVESQLQSLRAEQADIEKRQSALEFMMDEYLSAYDQLIETNEPITRAELDFLEHRRGELESQDKGARYTLQQIENQLLDTLIEKDVIEAQINKLEGYLSDLNDHLKRFQLEYGIGELFDQYPNITDLRNYLKAELLKDIPADTKQLYQRTLSRINKQPSFFYDVRFLQSEIRSTIDTIQRASKGVGYLQDRINALTAALSDKQEIERIDKKINSLKNVFAGLAKEFQSEKAAKAYSTKESTTKVKTIALTTEDAKAIQENEKLFSEFITEPPTGEDVEREIEYWSTDKPVMVANNNPLFKSADSHYPNDKINPQPYTQRFFKFTSQVDLADGYYIQPVTEDNDIYNIRYTSEPSKYPDDIKFIVVKNTPSGYKPVNINGKVIDNPTSDNLIYSSLYGSRELLEGGASAVQWVRNNMAPKDLTDDQILSKINDFLSFRQSVKAAIKSYGVQYYPIISKSNGVQNRVPKDSVTGEYQQLPVEGRLTDKNPDWEKVDLVVSTINGQIAGSTNVTMKPGRLAIRLNGSVIQVYNRLLLDSEIARLKRVIKQLTYSFGRKSEYEALKLTVGRLPAEEEASYTKDINNANIITQYLSTILYWDRPQSGKVRSKNQFQIEAGMLKRGSGSDELSIPFNAESIDENIETLLDGVYHQVANRLINDPNPYRVLDVNNNGELTYETWNSYKEYLLSSKGRSNGETPIYTNIVERTSDQTVPQLINVYLSYSPEPVGKPVGQTETRNKEISIDKETPSKLSGDYIIKYENPTKGTALDIHFSWSSSVNSKVTKVAVTKGEVAEKTATDTANFLLELIRDIDNPDATSAYTVDGKDAGPLDKLASFRKAGLNISLFKESFVEPNYDKAVNEPDPKLEATIEVPVQEPSVPETPTIQDDTPPAPSAEDILKMVNRDFSESQDDDNYRVRLYSDNTEYIKENESEVRKWFDINLPQYPVNFVDNLIKGKYWGQFKGGAIWISREAEQGTGFHEAFEAVWNSILTEEQQQSLIDEFKKRPNYKSQIAQTAQTWKGLDESELIKEALAEEFREYVINDGKTPLPQGQPKKNGFFRKLWNFIKGLFIRTNNEELLTIDNLFRKLNTQGFANTPLRNYDKAVANFKRIPNVSQEISTQLIEGMAAQFFKRLFSKQENTDSLFSKESNYKLINDILSEIRSINTRSWEVKSAGIAAYEAGIFKTIPRKDEEIAAMLNNLTMEQLGKVSQKLDEYRTTNKYYYKDKLNIIAKFKESVLPIFYDYLRQFGFVIKSSSIEEDVEPGTVSDVENREFDATDTLGIKDSITIDTRNTANTTVKLLVASLLDSEYNAAGQIEDKLNKLGLPKLVDYDKTLNTLFNELQGISTVFKDGKRVDALDLMFDKLDSKYKDATTDKYRPGYLWILDLKRKLAYADKNGIRRDPTTLKEEQIRLRVAFTKTFSKSKNNPSKLIFGDGGAIYSLDPITSSNVYRIRESWENNAKASMQRSNDFLKISDNKIVINTESPKTQSLLKSRDPLQKIELLRNLGIVFSIPDSDVITKYQSQFGDAALRISSFIENGIITTFDDLFSKQIVNGPINTLLSIELSNNADNLSLQYRNPEGQNEYSIVNPSNISNVLNSLKQVSNIKDFILSNPQYGTIDGNNIRYKTYIQNSEVLRLGGKIFDESGRKRKDLNYRLISGIARATEAGGEITAKLKRTDKVIQEMYYILDGSYYTIINSDKSSEFALDFGEFVPMFDFTSSSKAYTPETRRIYTNHLLDEVKSLITLSRGIGSNIQYYSQNQKEGDNWMLSHFRDVIKDASSIRLLQQVIKNDTPELFVNDPKVQLEIEQYLSEFIKRQQKLLLELGLVESLSDGTYRTNAFSQEQLNNFSKQGLKLNVKEFDQTQFDNLSRYIFINHQIAVREQHKLIYDHPAMYKDLPKRSNGATSTKEAVVDSPEILAWMDINKPREDKKIRASETIPTFKVVSYADVNTVSLFYKDLAEGMYNSMIKDVSKETAEKRIGANFNDDGSIKSLILDSKGRPTGDIKAYLELNEADAHAMIMPDFYNDLLFLSAKLSGGQSRQIAYEMAYERQQRSKKNKDHLSYKDYTPEQKAEGLPQKDIDILSQGNPGYVLPILKPQYFGPQIDPNHIHISFLKHSVQPRFYRFFEDTNFEQLYVQAQRNQIDIIGYESGEKVGNVFDKGTEFVSFYNEDGSINSLENTAILPPIQQMYTKYYGIQVEMAAKLKESVIRGTQMTKIVMSNLFKDGIPIKPEYQTLINNYNETLRHLTRLGKRELLEELGLQHLEDGSYVTYDLKKLVTTLRDEAAKRDLPTNIIEAFEASLQDSVTGLVYKFDSFSNRDKIDNILNSIVDSRIISQKVHGKAAVQAAVTLTEPLNSKRTIVYLDNGIYKETKDINILSDEQKKSARIASSDLKFYKIKGDRITAMEVYLPHWFKELYGKDEELDINKLDSRLLNVIGFRIPTQGMNSIDNIVVKGFLSAEEGDTVVVPSEIVGKSGSDFDIDKLNVYIPNYKIVDGVPIYIEPGDINNKKSLENQLITQLSQILSLPENYRQLVVPNGAETLKSLEQEIQSLMGIKKEKTIPFTQLSEWNYMNETRERFLVGKQLVGIGAIHITNHALSQVSDINLTGFYDDQAIKIKFPHNERDGELYLSAITDKAGQWISELLSEALTGFVDAAKDPFVFNLNINPATAGTYFYLMRLGVPISSIAYFHTQPIIVDYIKNQQTNESLLNKINGNELNKREITMLTISEYVSKAFPGIVKDQDGNNSDLRSLFYAAQYETSEFDYQSQSWVSYSQIAYNRAVRRVNQEVEMIRSKVKNYTDNTLKRMISDYANNNSKLNADQAALQLSILYDFLDYQQQASALGDFINGFSYDTARTKNIIENKLQQFKYEKVLRQQFISNPYKILEDTFIGEMKKEKDDIPKMFANYFVALHPNAQSSFDRIYALVNNDNINMSDIDKTEILNRYQNFFLGYLLHTIKMRIGNTDESINNFYGLLFGNNSFAHQVKTLQAKYPDNKLFLELFPIISTDRSNTDNVKMFTSKLSTYEANSTIEAAVNLLEQAESDPTLRKFMDNLAIFTIIQSGVQQSPISYTKILPNELYANLVGQIFDKFTDTPFEADPNIIYKQFFQNNYDNSTIVPSGAKGSVSNDNILTVKGNYRIAGYDYLSVRSINKKPDGSNYSRSEIEELKKNKNWKTLYTTTLYEKFFHDDVAKYKPINKLGNRIFAVEVYSTDTSVMTADQIMLSSINGYVDESSYYKFTQSDTNTKTDIPANPDQEIDSTKDNLTCDE